MMMTSEHTTRPIRRLHEPETPHTQSAANLPDTTMIQAKLAMLSEKQRMRVMEKQIRTFEEKIRICQAAYSPELAASILSSLRGADNQPVTSILNLKRYLQYVEKRKHPSDQTVVYCQWYINNFTYLKELKANFDQRIYLPLTNLYQEYNTGAVSRPTSLTILESDETIPQPTDQRPQTTESVLKFKNDIEEVRDLYDFSEIDNVTARLDYTRQRWQHLLDDEATINPAMFSCNSVIQVPSTIPPQVHNLLRLVPDVLLKCNNAATLSLQWLEAASSKSFDLQTKYNKLERVRDVLTERLSGLHDEIHREETQLEEDTVNLEVLVEQEERANEIMSKTRDLDQRINSLIKLMDQTEQEKIDLEQAMTDNSNSRHELVEMADNSDATRRLEMRMLGMRQELQVLEYKREILNEDLRLELELKPTIVRFTDQLQDSCERKEQELDKKRLEKKSIESALVPVIEDSRRTQAELTRSNTAVTTPRL